MREETGMSSMKTIAALAALLSAATAAQGQSGNPLIYRSAFDDYRRIEVPADPSAAWRALNDEASLPDHHADHGEQGGNHAGHGTRPGNAVEHAPAPKGAYMRHVTHTSRPPTPSSPEQDAHKHHHY
jgi:hypothetical protein